MLGVHVNVHHVDVNMLLKAPVAFVPVHVIGILYGV
jgi:hypothetical protein